MPVPRGLRALPVLVVSTLGGCLGGSPAPAPRAAPPPVRAFDADRAWSHLLALSAIGPRVAGTPGGREAAAYIRGQLTGFGFEVLEQPVTLAPSTSAPEAAETAEVEQDAGAGPPSSTTSNLRAVIPGESSDLLILAAPYDTHPFEEFEFIGSNLSAAPTAVLLELARVLRERPLPYTTWVVFFGGEAPRVDPSGQKRKRRGSQTFVESLKTEGLLPKVRFALVLDQVGDADLTLSRDLASHRLYRETFWKVGRRLGYAHAFRPEPSFLVFEASHYSFVERGMADVVALSDLAYGGDEPPGTYWNTEEDTPEHCSPQSLETVGVVSLAALDEISETLRKVDRFATYQGPEPSSPEAEEQLEEGDAPTEPTPAESP